MNNKVLHTIDPIYNSESKILILGSFPSVKSREMQFYYGHPQNRFWKVLARAFGAELPTTIDEKKAFLYENKIAVWDVIHSCEIVGSSDSSIKNVVPNNIGKILENSRVSRIFVNGKKAEELYKKYIQNDVKIEAICLPSTSPANAMWSEDRLAEFWRERIMENE